MIPKLKIQPKILSEKAIFSMPDCEVEINFNGNEKKAIETFFQAIDGTQKIQHIAEIHSDKISIQVEDLISQLFKHRVISDVSKPEGRSGIDVLFELEDLVNELLYKVLYKNIFWQKCQAAEKKGDIPINVMHGLVIENFHFLHRESYFDAPVLSYVSNTAVRLLMNEFYSEEYGHDELLMKSLNSIGISREELSQTIPLPQTMAMCNALAYWSHNDPLFFFSTLGILEGKDIRQDSFIEAALRMDVEKEFIAPVQAHSAINLKGEHGSLTRAIFTLIPIIDLATIERLRAQTHLFIELYDEFYSGIWNHYATSPTLLRLLKDFEG